MKPRNLLRYFLVFIGFAAAFAIYFYMNKAGLNKEFLAATAKVPSIRNFGSETVEKISQLAGVWGPLVGVAFGLVSWLASMILYALLKIIRLARFGIANIIVLLLVYGAYLALAIQLLNYEKRFSAISIGIIFFAGRPMYFAAIVAMSVAVAVYLLPTLFRMLRKIIKRPKTEKPDASVPSKNSPVKTTAFSLLLVAMTFVFSGCDLISGLEMYACMLSPDSSHCYQDAAVSSGDADDCDKVAQPAQFKSSGSNPPQDKCYLMVAQNTGDLSACDKIKGGPMSYTREECILGASLENEIPAGCQMLSGSDKQRCVSGLGPKMTPDKALEIDSQIELIKSELAGGNDPELTKQLQGLEDRRAAILAIMTKENKTQYEIQSDPLNKEIIGDWAVGDFDSGTKNKLIDMNMKLKANGITMTDTQYQAFRDYYKFINDPANDIEQMDDAALAKDRFGDKVGNVVDKLKFWKTNDTAAEKGYDEQLRFYERMLARQQAIADGLSEAQQEMQEAAGAIAGGIGNYAADKAKDKIIESIFGEITGKTAGVTTAVLGEALSEVQAAAKSAEFRGLVRAYDLGMNEELPKFGGDVERAHAAVVKAMSADPYTYADDNSFAKFGNLIENKDCDGSNPHCLNKDVFWKSMKKSYKYQHSGQ